MLENYKKSISQFWVRHGITTVGWLAIVANLLIVLFLFHARNTYHVDELFSFGHANSTQGAWIIPGVVSPWKWTAPEFERETGARWYPGRIFHHWLTVQPGETFHYKSIWKNLASDVHPPLHYALLHTVCSFTPDVFSKWHGAVINIPLWLLLLWRLFKLSKLFFKESFYAWCTVILYAYSEVGLDTVLFIRGYLLQTLLAVCLVEQVTRILQENQASIWRCLCIGGITTLGMLTHYNSLPFAALIGIIAGSILCSRKEWQLCWRLGITLTAGFALFVALFPPAIDVIINSGRGKEAFANYAGNPIWSFIRGEGLMNLAGEYFSRFWQGTRQYWFFLYAGGLVTLAYKYLRTKEPRLIDWVLALVAMTGVYAVFTMPKNMGVYGIRYTMFIYPLAALVTVWYMKFVIQFVLRGQREVWVKRTIGLLVLINSLGVWSFAQTSPFTFRMEDPIALQDLVGKRIVVQGLAAPFYWADGFAQAKEVYWLVWDAPVKTFLESLDSADILLRYHYAGPLDPALEKRLQWKHNSCQEQWKQPYDEYVIVP